MTSTKTLHAVPDDMGPVEAAWVEPAATALRAVRQAGDLTGRSVLIVGGGPIGHLCGRLSRLFGAARVWLMEPSPDAAPLLTRRASIGRSTRSVMRRTSSASAWMRSWSAQATSTAPAPA